VEFGGCADMITFGGDGSFFKTDCNHSIHQYSHTSQQWLPLGSTKAFSFAADA
jgi:hypothetical protein